MRAPAYYSLLLAILAIMCGPQAVVLKKHLSQSGFHGPQAVLDALPQFDSSKLPQRYNAPPPRPPKPGASPPARSPPPDASVVAYEARYGSRYGSARALAVRRDGGASAAWPGGDLAVTVEPDYAAPLASSGSSPSKVGADGR
jgi:hypothetical protein